MRLRYFVLLGFLSVPYLILTTWDFSLFQTVRQDNLLLSSAVSGQLFDQGKPVVGAKVVRVLSWNMDAEPRTEITFTSDRGHFQFPEVRGAAEFGFLAKLFHVPTVSIRIYVPVDGVDYLFYANGRSSYQGHGETGFPQIQISCDLKSRSVEDELLPVGECEVELTEEIKNRKYD